MGCTAAAATAGTEALGGTQGRMAPPLLRLLGLLLLLAAGACVSAQGGEPPATEDGSVPAGLPYDGPQVRNLGATGDTVGTLYCFERSVSVYAQGC